MYTKLCVAIVLRLGDRLSSLAFRIDLNNKAQFISQVITILCHLMMLLLRKVKTKKYIETLSF